MDRKTAIKQLETIRDRAAQGIPRAKVDGLGSLAFAVESQWDDSEQVEREVAEIICQVEAAKVALDRVAENASRALTKIVRRMADEAAV